MTIRMPSAAERRAHHIADDEPALEIVRSDGAVEVHGAGLTEVVFMPSDPDPGQLAPVAKRQRVIDDVRHAIVTGGLRPGDQLPSEGQLAISYGTSRTTIRRALAELCELGLARLDRASGTLVLR